MVRIFNVSTSPISLAFYGEEDTLYEKFVLDENSGNYVKQFQKRVDTKVSESVWIEGTHHEKMNKPKFVDVSDENFGKIEKCPLFGTLLETGKVRTESITKAQAAKARAAKD